jgi:hypothetical protein
MRRYLWILLPLIAGLFAGKMLGRWAKQSGPLPAIDPLILLAALPLAAFFVILWHEAGHLLGGRLGGFRPRLLGVGPLLVRWHHGRAALELNRAWELWGGFASALPPRDTPWDLPRLQRSLLLFTAGGPIASLLLALIAALLTLALPAPARIAAGVVALLSAAIALATLQPWGAGAGIVSDGGRLLMLRRGGPAIDRWSALMMLAGLNLDGVRPRDWPPALIAIAAGPADGLTDHTAGLFHQLEHAWDSGDETTAQTALDQILAHRPRLTGFLAQSADHTQRLWDAHHRHDHAAYQATLREIAKNRLAVSTGSYLFYQELTSR